MTRVVVRRLRLEEVEGWFFESPDIERAFVDPIRIEFPEYA
jgi:hypothetical protein